MTRCSGGCACSRVRLAHAWWGWILVACCRGKSVAHAVTQSFHRLEWPWTCHRSAGANPTQEALRSSLLASRTQLGRNFFVGYGVISTALIVRSILVLHSVGLWGHPEHEVVHNVRDDYALLHTLVSSVLCLLVALMKPHTAINTMLHWAAFVQFLASQWLALDIVQYIVRMGQAGSCGARRPAGETAAGHVPEWSLHTELTAARGLVGDALGTLFPPGDV